MDALLQKRELHGVSARALARCAFSDLPMDFYLSLLPLCPTHGATVRRSSQVDIYSPVIHRAGCGRKHWTCPQSGREGWMRAFLQQRELRGMGVRALALRL